MIHTETYEINGRIFVKTWSDTGYVKRDGIVYEEANDPADLGRIYEEVDNSEETTSGEVIDDIDNDTEESQTVSDVLNERIRFAARYASV